MSSPAATSGSGRAALIFMSEALEASAVRLVAIRRYSCKGIPVGAAAIFSTKSSSSVSLLAKMSSTSIELCDAVAGRLSFKTTRAPSFN